MGSRCGAGTSKPQWENPTVGLSFRLHRVCVGTVVSPSCCCILAITNRSGTVTCNRKLPLPSERSTPRPEVGRLTEFTRARPKNPPYRFGSVVPLARYPRSIRSVRNCRRPLTAGRRARCNAINRTLRVTQGLLPFVPSGTKVLVIPYYHNKSTFATNDRKACSRQRKTDRSTYH